MSIPSREVVEPFRIVLIPSMRCPSWASELQTPSRFCPSCGHPAELAGLTPGSILAGRYRIVGLLGRGGMGEVYRADDMKLGQTVA